MKSKLTKTQAKNLIQRYEESDCVYRHDASFSGVTILNVRKDTFLEPDEEVIWHYEAKVNRYGESPNHYTDLNIEESELIAFSDR